MGSRLTYSLAMASEQAAKSFENKYRCDSYRTIAYGVGENIMIVNNVQVQVYPRQYGNSDLHCIDIFWEEANVTNYRELGLYGRYSCTYNEMEFKDDTLVIKSDGGMKIYIN